MKSIGASRRDCLRWLGAAGAAAGLAGLPLRAGATPLERVRERGTLTVGVYQDMPPFEGVMNQEAVWSIKAYLETRREKPF